MINFTNIKQHYHHPFGGLSHQNLIANQALQNLRGYGNNKRRTSYSLIDDDAQRERVMQAARDLEAQNQQQPVVD